MNAKQWYQRRVHGYQCKFRRPMRNAFENRGFRPSRPKKKKYRLRGRSSETAKAHRG
eukprot:TRINITY_DN3452_c0_g2_i1.p1 TRINITY_DN3452_c0_g2~~TRINITY_DN3452_c0_g2_i1.p1  ORF type:complete len:57 (+),score=40.20 TRINITY_DN3452_c0_g2_i1:341-511(+)